MSQRTEGEFGSVTGCMSEGARGLRRLYKAPFAERLDVGQTAQGEPDPVKEAGANAWGRLGTS